MIIPNRLTLLRFGVALAFMASLLNYEQSEWVLVSILLFVTAGITDFYDGILARRYDLETDFGKLMDPLADKITMLVAFVYFVKIPELAWPPWLVILLLAREFAVNSLRTFAAVKGNVLSAATSGKYKTAVQMAGIFLILIALLLYRRGSVYYVWLQGVSWTTMFLVLLLTIYSGIEYFYRNGEIFSDCFR
ncbi:MAG: CDP-diacylglycerol--glycerol-3-phosphate 3-phosphatidyltransferase [bacterium]